MPKNKKDKKPTIMDVIEAISDFSSRVDKKFEEIKEKFKEVNRKLDKKPDRNEIFSWGDKQVIPLGIDVDKLKYIHRHELKSLPDTYEISRALVEEELKKRKK